MGPLVTIERHCSTGEWLSLKMPAESWHHRCNREAACRGPKHVEVRSINYPEYVEVESMNYPKF